VKKAGSLLKEFFVVLPLCFSWGLGIAMKARLAYFAAAAASLAQYLDCREGDSLCNVFGAVISLRS
jgi:hypothetical protein